jgi:hypothetical protein
MSKARLEVAQHPTPLGSTANGRVCAGTRRDGERCNAPASPGVRYCYNHDPAKAAERRRNASRAGKSKPSSRVKGLDSQLARLYEDTLAGRVDKSVAAVLTQIIHGRTRLLESERRILEVEAFEERVTELEAIVAERTGSRVGGRR